MFISIKITATADNFVRCRYTGMRYTDRHVFKRNHLFSSLFTTHDDRRLCCFSKIHVIIVSPYVACSNQVVTGLVILYNTVNRYLLRHSYLYTGFYSNSIAINTTKMLNTTVNTMPVIIEYVENPFTIM